MIICLLSELPVARRIHQALHLIRLAHFNFCQPAIALGATVYRGGLLFEHAVGFDNRSRDWSHNVRSGFDGFDGADGLASGDLEVGRGQFNEHDITEGFGGVF